MSTAPKVRVLHVLPAKDGRFFVRIKARNGLIVGDLSQTYANPREAGRAAASMCAAKLVLAPAPKPRAPAKKAARKPSMVERIQALRAETS